MFKQIKASWAAAIVFAGLAGGLVSMVALPSGTAAANDCEKSILGINPWYKGMTEGSGKDCKVKPVPDDAGTEGEQLQIYIWTIVLNVIEIVLRIIAYLAVIMIIYGGFLYITSSGNADATAKALKAIINASVGLAIAITAVALKNFVWENLIAPGNDYGIPERDAGEILVNGLNMAYFVAGALSVMMIIGGGLRYVTSSGDSGKTAKAKNTILYAVIGLVVVVFAFAITTFINSQL